MPETISAQICEFCLIACSKSYSLQVVSSVYLDIQVLYYKIAVFHAWHTTDTCRTCSAVLRAICAFNIRHCLLNRIFFYRGQVPLDCDCHHNIFSVICLEFCSHLTKKKQLRQGTHTMSTTHPNFIHKMYSSAIGAGASRSFVFVVIEIARHTPERWPPIRYRWHFSTLTNHTNRTSKWSQFNREPKGCLHSWLLILPTQHRICAQRIQADCIRPNASKE